jgi:hypothetical protein
MKIEKNYMKRSFTNCKPTTRLLHRYVVKSRRVLQVVSKLQLGQDKEYILVVEPEGKGQL